jgi:hypothetical protein
MLNKVDKGAQVPVNTINHVYDHTASKAYLLEALVDIIAYRGLMNDHKDVQTHFAYAA